MLALKRAFLLLCSILMLAAVVPTAAHADPASYQVASYAVTPNGTTAYVATKGTNITHKLVKLDLEHCCTVPYPNAYVLPHEPVNARLSPDGAHVYLTAKDATGNGVLDDFDTATNTVTRTLALNAALGNSALSPDGSRSYVFAGNDLKIVDNATFTVVASTTLAGPGDVAVDPAGSQVWVTNGPAGTVTVLDALTGAVLDTIANLNSPISVQFKPNGTSAYVVSVTSYARLPLPTVLYELDATTHVATQRAISVPTLTISPDGLTGYVVRPIYRDNAGTEILDLTTYQSLGWAPANYAGSMGIVTDDTRPFLLSPDGTRAYYSTNPGTDFRAVDLVTLQELVRAPFPVMGPPPGS